MFSKIFLKIKDFFIILGNINKINSSNAKFVFYSEGKSYQKYAYLIIEYLSKRFPGQVHYVSSEKNDYFLEFDVINTFIGNNFFLQYFFKTIKTDNLFITLTDLNNSIIKRNKFVKNYIYYFHGSVSTTKVYTESAFDNYDTVLCNGNYHYNEIRKRENLALLKSKKLVKSGFYYFDYLNIKKNELINKPDEILVAPSWNKNKTNFINDDFQVIIENLLKFGFKIRFRPHPETLKRSPKLMTYYKYKFKGDNFIFDEDSENLTALNNAKCLITDNSGISIEFALIFKKPIIYYDDFDKVHNTKFDMYSDMDTMENKVKKKKKKKFSKNQILNINDIINNSLYNFDENEIDNFLNENFYNFSRTKDFFEKNFSSICI